MFVPRLVRNLSSAVLLNFRNENGTASIQTFNSERDATRMRAYAARYPAEEFEIVALEKGFEGNIINPKTGAASRSFVLAGKVDGIVRLGDQHFLLESKSAAVLDESYLEKLWTDFQISLYAFYIEQTLGLHIAGILYNVLVKARLQQGAGETESEFEARRAELLAKSKTGKTAASWEPWFV